MHRSRFYTVAVLGLMLAVASIAHAQTTSPSPPAERSTTDKAKDAARSTGDAVSDSWITAKTKMSLMADERVSATDVNVTTRQGVVTLTGKVPSDEAKKAAAANAEKIDGAKRVINNLTVVAIKDTKRIEREDDQITQDVEDRLKKDKGLKQADIDVKTENGIVTLTGEAPSLRSSVRASEVAHRVPGVRAVQNELKVKGEGARG
jgi:hyperosmotically inducible protein